MFFSGSGKNGLKTGANWGSTILFDPHSDESRGTVHKINDDSLIEDMSDLIDASEMIKRIWGYKHPLFPWQFTQLFLCHQFVLIETNTWWWSNEKNSEHILIQRSKQLSSVRDFENRRKRTTPLKELSFDKRAKIRKRFSRVSLS